MYFLLLSLMLVASLVSLESAFAIEEKERMDIHIKPSTQSINISWNDVGDSYTIYSVKKDEKTHLWSGRETKFQHKNLEPDHIMKYKVVAFKRGKKIDEVIIGSSTLKTRKMIEERTKSIVEG